jgi:hypothetical protein
VVELRGKQVIADLDRGQRLHRQFTQRRAPRREHHPTVPARTRSRAGRSERDGAQRRATVLPRRADSSAPPLTARRRGLEYRWRAWRSYLLSVCQCPPGSNHCLHGIPFGWSHVAPFAVRRPAHRPRHALVSNTLPGALSCPAGHSEARAHTPRAAPERDDEPGTGP